MQQKYDIRCDKAASIMKSQMRLILGRWRGTTGEIYYRGKEDAIGMTVRSGWCGWAA